MSTILDAFQNPHPLEDMNKMMFQGFAEFMATTIFVFMGTLSIVATDFYKDTNFMDVAQILPVAMTFGVAFMSLMFAMMHISGGHMNPAITFMMFLRGEMSMFKMFFFWFFQMVGGLVGAALTWGSVSEMVDKDDEMFRLGSTMMHEGLNSGNGFLIEFMGSFFFFFVFCQCVQRKVTMPAFPIGFALMAVTVCLFPFTGAGVNPARTFGPSMIVCMASEDNCKRVAGDWSWIYYAGPMAAAWFAAEISCFMASFEEVSSDDDTHDHTAMPEKKVDDEPDIEA